MSRFNSWVAGARVKSLAHGITKIFLLVGSYTMLSWHYKRCLCSSTCESSLWDLDYVTSKQHTKIYAQTVQHLLCKLGSTRPVLYSEGLDSAKKKTIIIIDEKQLYSKILGLMRPQLAQADNQKRRSQWAWQEVFVYSI